MRFRWAFLLVFIIGEDFCKITVDTTRRWVIVSSSVRMGMAKSLSGFGRIEQNTQNENPRLPKNLHR